MLHRLFRQALRVGKRVRTETAIGENPASVSSAAAELAERVFDDLPGRGPPARRRQDRRADRAQPLSRAARRDRGRQPLARARRRLARRFGGRALGSTRSRRAGARGRRRRLDRLQGYLVAPASRAGDEGRRGRPVFFIDIAVPRDLDPAINELEGCYLYDIDDLERVVEAERRRAPRGGGAAEAIVSEEAERSVPGSARSTSCRRSRRSARAPSRSGPELARAEPRLGALSPSQRRAVESLTSQIVEKLLHLPTVRMKEAAAAPRDSRRRPLRRGGPPSLRPREDDR